MPSIVMSAWLRVLSVVVVSCVVCVLAVRDENAVSSLKLVAVHDQTDPVEMQYEMTVGGNQRTFYMYVPESYNTSTAQWPLLFFFHGMTDACQSAHNFMIAGYTQEQVKRRFLLVTPCGLGKIWQGVVDLPFTEAMLDAITGEYRIDSARIYGSGFSNGAGMSEYLACRVPNRFTGLASAAGWVMGDYFPGQSNTTNFKLLQQCDTLFAQANSTVHILKLQGSVDPTVEPYGRTAVPGTRDDFYGWALRNGCKGSPTTEFESKVYKYEQFKDCPEDVTVRLYFVYGIPHQWVVNNQVNYNRIIMDNFKLVAPTNGAAGRSSRHPHNRHH